MNQNQAIGLAGAIGTVASAFAIVPVAAGNETALSIISTVGPKTAMIGWILVVVLCTMAVGITSNRDRQNGSSA